MHQACQKLCQGITIRPIAIFFSVKEKVSIILNH